MKIILDTNFILACMKQKIDFFSLANELFDDKIEFIVPEEVISELELLSTRKNEKGKDKDAAKFALKFIAKIRPEFIVLGEKNVDLGIINYANETSSVIATLDKGLKSKFGGKILTIRDKKGLEII